jgi:hypothetical protein
MKNTDLAWIAGYLEGKGFSIHMGTRKRKDGTRGPNGCKIAINATGSKLEQLRLFAIRIGRPVYTWKTRNGLGETFEHESRTAVYTDSKTPIAEVVISASVAKDLIKRITPYLSKQTLAKCDPIINYQFISNSMQKHNTIPRTKQQTRAAYARKQAT